jgi:diguanylate cyclase (GGDEF)-like protein
MIALLRKALLPRSLAGRVFAIFSLALLLFLGAGLGVFYRFQFLQHIEENQANAAALVELAAQAVEDSVVIGDYDAVKRTLHKALVDSPFKEAAFVDLDGGVVRVTVRPAQGDAAPIWLEHLVRAKLYDVNRVATVGGTDYGVIRLSFDANRIAARLWLLVRQAALLAGAAFVVGLVLVRWVLKHWLLKLERLRSYQPDANAAQPLGADTPLEIQEAIKAVNRTAASLHSQYGERIGRLMHSLVQHKSAMDQAAIVSEVDADGRLVEVNGMFVHNCGLAREELIGQELARVGAPCGAGTGWTPSRSVWNGEVMIVGPHGTRQWYRTVVPIFMADGAVEKYICIDIDISKRKQFERAILENASRQTLVAAFGRTALAANDIDELLREACAAAQAGLGGDFAALFEHSQGKLVLRAGIGWNEAAAGTAFEHDSAASLPCPAELALAHGIHSGASADIVCRERVFGSLAVFSQACLRHASADIHFLESLATIVATAIERHEANKRLSWLAQYDSLTNLPNRRHLASCIEQTLELARRRCQCAAIMFIDLDHFKHVNDMLGHGAGDELLVLASRRLAQCVRASDVVARLGGDEFAVVLPDVCSQADAAVIAAKLIDALARPFELLGQQIFVSASIGIASYPADGANADGLLKSADIAMYSAKNNGRNNYQFYDARMNEQAAQRMLLESQLRGALDRNEFVLDYQPKAELADWTLCGFEALLRWRHPERGLVPPLEFIPILEDTGQILQVGEWVIGEVCRQLRAWQRAGRQVIPIAINLSARQLQQRDLAARIAKIVDAAGVDPCLLEFELTESMLMTDPEAAVATLTALKARGMRLSVDDFGTGYSSLAYLKRFPLDALKIDRTFVRDLAHDADDAAITKAVIRLAHSLSLRVVAEGVETIEQVRMLEDYGCDQVQGYYVGRPMPARECADLLAPARVPEPA